MQPSRENAIVALIRSAKPKDALCRRYVAIECRDAPQTYYVTDGYNLLITSYFLGVEYHSYHGPVQLSTILAMIA